MSTPKALPSVLVISLFAYASEAEACGGFFCGRQPVDQTAERILFEVADDSITMTTQISFNGAAPDFAWILPLSAVPDVESLSTFPQRALTALDANTGPLFIPPADCPIFVDFATPTAAGGGAAEDPGVTVHIRAEVGDYDVAVIESEDPNSLIEWLRAEEYRVTSPMEPYIELYTAEGMKFLALKLVNGADVTDLKPFRFTLPGDTPSIPLRMTAIAAEPEMSILVFVLGDQRYEAKNWENVSVDDSQIRFNPYDWGETNWTKLVAEAVDEAGGQGWVTEFAGTTTSYADLVRAQVDNGNFNAPEDEEAAVALLAVLDAHPYMTRLYTRLSAEEMTLDPILGRSSLGDVAREHQLSKVVDGIDQCSTDLPESIDPCDFATCGAGGICRSVPTTDDLGNEVRVAACGCVPGATARTTFAPDGSVTVICQDQRLSFLNPGDQEAGMETLSDPCADFDCGAQGSCVPVNMTPTCVCDQGLVAMGSLSAEGARLTACVQPELAIPDSFYDRRLPDLPAAMPGGKEVSVPDPEPSASGGTGSGAGATDGEATDGSEGDAATSTTGGSSAGDPSGLQGEPSAVSSEGGGCTIGHTKGRGAAAWTLLLLLGLGFCRRASRG